MKKIMLMLFAVAIFTACNNASDNETQGTDSLNQPSVDTSTSVRPSATDTSMNSMDTSKQLHSDSTRH